MTTTSKALISGAIFALVSLFAILADQIDFGKMADYNYYTDVKKIDYEIERLGILIEHNKRIVFKDSVTLTEAVDDSTLMAGTVAMITRRGRLVDSLKIVLEEGTSAERAKDEDMIEIKWKLDGYFQDYKNLASVLEHDMKKHTKPGEATSLVLRSMLNNSVIKDSLSLRRRS